MSRPPKAERRIRQEIYFPESDHNRVALLLYSPAEGRVPHGAWSEFVVACVRATIARAASQQPTPEGT
jgi:hypothetical protein